MPDSPLTHSALGIKERQAEDPVSDAKHSMLVRLAVPQAIAISQALLPSLKATAENPEGWLYCDSPVESQQFEDIGGKLLVELVSDAHAQREVPDNNITILNSTQLLAQIRTVVAATFLTRRWPCETKRQKVAAAVAGILLRRGQSAADVHRFIKAVAEVAGDPKANLRAEAAEAAERSFRNNRGVPGWPKLEEALGIDLTIKFQYLLEPEPPSAICAMVSEAPSPSEAPGQSIRWPKLSEEAFHGLVGEIVEAISPHSEADPVALVMQTHVAFGNVIGHGPHFKVEADRHTLNLFANLVGSTAKARKGTSWGQVVQLFSGVDSVWVAEQITSGLSSGEGLAWRVRNPDTREQEHDTGDGHGDDTKENAGLNLDKLHEDKRLMVCESEFASTLKVLARDGNTLSALLRQAWDSGDLSVLTKKSPVTASDAHISIIGHITRDELLTLFAKLDMCNGFANRFLWTCVRRSKILPEGGNFSAEECKPIVSRLREAVQFATKVSEIHRDPEARKLWREVYPQLSEGKPGLFGSVTSRAEAQVVRLSCIYALLDHSAVIRAPHLQAALAFWKYCEDSARYIFGDRLRDPVAERILQALRQSPNGLTKTEISALFDRHVTAGSIDRALVELEELGLATSQQEETGGRPTQRWVIQDAKKAK
jgi:Protein of unknown function (DUF3987)